MRGRLESFADDAGKNSGPFPIWHLIAVAVQAAALIGLLWLLLTSNSGGAGRGLPVTLAIIALFMTCWNAGPRQRLWKHQLRGLCTLVARIRMGGSPIEELSAIDGPMKSLALEISTLFHDLGAQRVELAAMRQTLRQQVASRTNALERTIGSLRRQASLDSLTGLFNRRALDTHLPDAMQRCREAESKLCLLMIDIDHFKHLNDSLGHPAGDEWLRNIGQIIRSTIRDGDLAFRYGGDEFAVVIEGYAADAGVAMAARLGSLADALAGTLKIVPVPRLSIGVAMLGDKPNVGHDEFLRMADEHLYAVKKARKSGDSISRANSRPAARAGAA